MQKICTFIGNKDVYLDVSALSSLKNLVIKLINENSVNIFYCGNYGNFDRYCEKILRDLKNHYRITVIFVTPYADDFYLKRLFQPMTSLLRFLKNGRPFGQPFC